MQSIRRGLLAGTLAGLLLVGLLFIDEGPGNQFSLVARAFALGDDSGSKGVSALLLIGLGGLLGGLFGLLLRHRAVSHAQSLCAGLVVGVGWWVVLFGLLGALVQRLPFSLYSLLLYLVLSLVYGMILGSLYWLSPLERGRWLPGDG